MIDLERINRAVNCPEIKMIKEKRKHFIKYLQYSIASTFCQFIEAIFNSHELTALNAKASASLLLELNRDLERYLFFSDVHDD